MVRTCTMDDDSSKNHKISPEFLLSQYTFVLQVPKDEDLPEARATLQSLARQLIYVVALKERFFNGYILKMVQRCLEQGKDVELLKETFELLQMYCENIVKNFWRKEFKTIKRHTGLYKKLQSVLPTIDKCFDDMGYVRDTEDDTLKLRSYKYLKMENVMKLGFDYFISCVLFQFLEDLYMDLKSEGYSWKQITRVAASFVGTEKDCLNWFRKNIMPDSEPTKNNFDFQTNHFNSAKGVKKVVRPKENGLVSNAQRLSSRNAQESVDPSYNNVEEWLKTSVHTDGMDYHFRQLERHRENARQQEIAKVEEQHRRRYIDMAKVHNHSNDVPRPYGEDLTFELIDRTDAVPKTSSRSKKQSSPEELPVTVPKSHRTRRDVLGAESKEHSGGRNGRSSAIGDISRTSPVNSGRKTTDYRKYLENGTFNLDDEEDDLYSDLPRASYSRPNNATKKLDVHVDKDSVIDNRSSGRVMHPPTQRHERYTNQFDSGLTDGVARSRFEGGGTLGGALPDVYSRQATLDDHMKNSLSALGLESETSSMTTMSIDPGYDEWARDYRARDAGFNEKIRDWDKFHDLQSVAQDYLNINKSDLLTPDAIDSGKLLTSDYDFPSFDIRRPPATTDDVLDMALKDMEQNLKMPPPIEKDKPNAVQMRQPKSTVPHMGVSGHELLTERPLELRKSATTRYSVNFPLPDTTTAHAVTVPAAENTKRRSAYGLATTDMTRPEYSAIVKESLKTPKSFDDIRRSASPTSRPTLSQIVKSLTDDSKVKSTKEDGHHYNSMPSPNDPSKSTWKCRKCKRINISRDFDICPNCSQKRHSVGNWQCEDCTLLNSPETDVCSMCDKSRAKGPEKEPLEIGGRECPKCTYINSTDARKCEICLDPLNVYAVHI